VKGQQIVFIYADPPGFSGQRNAAEIVITGARGEGYSCQRILTPTADRTGTRSKLWKTLYLKRVLGTGFRSLTKAFSGKTLVYMTCGQTLTGLIRDGLPFLLICRRRRNKKSVISLHGSNFMRWEKNARTARFLRLLIAHSTFVTVLGQRQREGLAALGIPPEKIRIVPNTTEFPAATEAEIRQKHVARTGPVRLLHLSSLTRTKGYTVFLEALEVLAGRQGAPIEAVLCGTIFITEYNDFSSPQEATDWIAAKIEAINRSGRVSVRWIRGSVGEAKRGLFDEADVFVLPTMYPVEAQPLVLLEAMARGCAIVSSDVGEIPAILSASEARLLSEPTTGSVAEALDQLVVDHGLRSELGRAGWTRFVSEFQPERHFEVWHHLFQELENGSR